MREDMFKVIVERPRLIHGNWMGGGREPGFRQRMARADVPAKVGMREPQQSQMAQRESDTTAPLPRKAGRPAME